MKQKLKVVARHHSLACHVLIEQRMQCWFQFLTWYDDDDDDDDGVEMHQNTKTDDDNDLSKWLSWSLADSLLSLSVRKL